MPAQLGFRGENGGIDSLFAVIMFRKSLREQVVSKPGLAPEGRSVFLQILQLQGCLSRFWNALNCLFEVECFSDAG